MDNIFRKKLINGWHRINYNYHKDLKNFLSPIEYECVPFTANITKNSKTNKKSFNNNKIFTEIKENKIISALLLTNDGTMYPAFTNETKTINIRKLLDIVNFKNKKNLTLMGKKEYVRKIENFFPGRNSFSIEYYLMAGNSKSIADRSKKRIDTKYPELYEEIEIYSAKRKDINILMPLRRDYELEEVVANQGDFNFTACKYRFLDTITNKKAIFAKKNNEVIGTCCINYKGYLWNSIGGVYTKPELRSKGISTALIGEIARIYSTENKNLSLFVKKNNKAAINLYEKTGFQHAGEYKITYFERR